MVDDALGASQVQAYLERLGIDEAPPVSAPGLALLHARHLERVPFENLSIHLGEEIVLDPAALVAKVVERRRGGFCYELNGAFAALLRALGFDVALLSARVHGGEGPGPPFDHMALRVTIDGEPWLADVGFGDSHQLPLRLGNRENQADPVGTFRLVEADDGDLDLMRDGAPQYRLDLTPHALAEFASMCTYHQTESHFTRKIVSSLATPNGRVTIRDGALIVTEDGQRRETAIADDELLSAYREHFGIVLERAPVVLRPPDEVPT